MVASGLGGESGGGTGYWVLGAGYWVLGARCLDGGHRTLVGYGLSKSGDGAPINVRYCRVMAGISKFEDLIAWQEARKLHQELFAVCQTPPMKNEFRLVSQILAASRSVGANIAEGFDRVGNREFHHALYIAKGSIAEVRSFLYSSLDEGRIQREEFERLKARTDSVSRLVGALRASVDPNRKRS